MKIRNKKEKEEYDMKKGIGVTISILSLGVFLALSFFIIAKKEIKDYKNIGIDVTYDERIKELVVKFVDFDYSKEDVNCEEIISNKEVAEKYNSVFNSTLKYNLESELKRSKVSIKSIVKEPDNEYRVKFHREFEIKFDKNSDTISGGMDDYTAYIVEKNGEFYIDRILNDVDFNQFKNSKSKIAKLFKSEEELFNEAMKSEIEARKNYEEYLKNL
ncbi:hypothetical protein GNF43_08655 [Clostridium perfringens]|uniref:Lipoprotein n=1 Tax=Clostridium perfringens TaxID=1502 RepID=A0AAW9IRI0_CLOPF|nr:hypothetical protein [Clostridium perfringens]MDZ5003434.1 hypothetical protein [Clostridium perfringens]MDZ5008558.1 hypothetical protein [Clostridium perfringens]MDZ5056964.1 hypothetical protein [Clostridium perfringens]